MNHERLGSGHNEVCTVTYRGALPLLYTTSFIVLMIRMTQHKDNDLCCATCLMPAYDRYSIISTRLTMFCPSVRLGVWWWGKPWRKAWNVLRLTHPGKKVVNDRTKIWSYCSQSQPWFSAGKFVPVTFSDSKESCDEQGSFFWSFGSIIVVTKQ